MGRRTQPNVGRSIEGSIGSSCHGVNEKCHGWTHGIDVPERPHVMKTPKVFAIYWDEYFDANRQAVYTMNQFFGQILTGSYMTQLYQYGGVEKGQFIGSTIIVPDPTNPPPAKPNILKWPFIEHQLREWINQRKVPVKPDPHETNLLYVIFTPSTTNIGDCVGGYHHSGRYDDPEDARKHEAGDDNLFWAAIQEWHYNGPPATPREFADSCTWVVSHEMVEAFTNRDGHGFHTKDCEIGDICECAQGSKDKKAPIIKAEVDGWWVGNYWDNENRSCYPLHIVPVAEAPSAGGYEIPRRR